MYPRAIAKRKICKIGRACGLGCVPKSHNCKVALRGQAKTAVEWLAHVTANPNYEAEVNAKTDKRLERFNARVKSHWERMASKDASNKFKKIQNNPDSQSHAITYWENGKSSALTYNQLINKIGKDEADQYIKKRLLYNSQLDQGTQKWQEEYRAGQHPYNQQNTPEDRVEQQRQDSRETVSRARQQNERSDSRQTTQSSFAYQNTSSQVKTTSDDYSGNINYVPPERVRKARKKLSTGTATPEDAKQIKTMSYLARSLAQKETTKGGKRLLDDVSNIWSYIASGMRLKNTIVVRSRDGVESAARITSQKNYIYVDYLASNPRNVAGGKGAISGSATAALVAVAKKAYSEGKGFHLSALSSAVPFYRKIGMTEVEPHHFKVKKDDVLEFINKNTPRKNNVKTN